MTDPIWTALADSFTRHKEKLEDLNVSDDKLGKIAVSNSIMTNPVGYSHGSYRRVGRYLHFTCKGEILKLPEGFSYNMGDSQIYAEYDGFSGQVAVVGWETKTVIFETRENPVSKFKVGQKVYCIKRGMGSVVSLETDFDEYPVKVHFANFLDCAIFTSSGLDMTKDLNPTLLTLEEARAKGYDVPKQKIVKEKTVYLNIYGNNERSYVHDTEQDAKYNARTKDANLLAAAYPVTIKYEIEE